MPPRRPRRIRCALLSRFRFDWPAWIMLASEEIDFFYLSDSALGLSDSTDAFALPLTDDVDVVMVSTHWYLWLAREHPDKLASVFAHLERAASVVVGLDSADEFGLAMPPEAYARFTIVLKPQGLYRDRELYNYEVGPLFAGANWTHKTRRRASPYSDADLAKLRLSVPCIMLDFLPVRRDGRRREATAAKTLDRDLTWIERVGRDVADALMAQTVRRAPIGGRPLEVHCLVQLSHVQRLEAVRMVSAFSGVQGVTSIPPAIPGTEYGFELPESALAEITAAAEPYVRPFVPRGRFMYDLCRHKIGVAPTGFGELGQRHAAVMRCGAALVCQDLSHVEMMFPIEDGVNASFCRPDLSDLTERIESLLSDEAERARIAAQGRRSLDEFSARWREHIFAGVEQPLREALGWVAA